MYRYLALTVTASLLLTLFTSQAIARQDRSADAETYYRQGRQLYSENRLEEAMEALQQAARLKPDFADAHLLLGNLYVRLQKWKEAIQSFKQSIKVKPDYAEAYHNLALAYVRMGSYRESVEPFKRAIQINPALFEPHLFLGLTYGKMGLLEAAFAELKQALNIKPDSAEAHFYLGMVYRDRSELKEAIEEFKQAVRIKPDYAEAHYTIGSANLLLGSYQVALESFKQALLNKSRMTPLQLSQIYFGMGQAQAGLSSFQEALALYRQSIELNPNNADAYYSLAAVFMQMASYREAIEALNRVIKVNPKMAEAHFQLGLAYGNLHEHDSSIAAYKQAIVINPAYSKAYYNLGETYSRIGNKEEALKQYEALKSRDPKLAESLLSFIQTGSVEGLPSNPDQSASPVPGLPVNSPSLTEAKFSIDSPVKLIEDEERKELTERLNESVETPMRFNNPDGAPMLIKEANIRGVRRDEQHWGTDGESALSDYVMRASLTLANTTTKRARWVSLRFANSEPKQAFYIKHIFVEHQKNTQVFIPFMVLTGDPSGLTVEVAEVWFEDESAWGSIPPQGAGSPDKAPGGSAAEAKPVAEVDAKPRLLTRSQPLYTQEARRNKVQGVVRLRLQIGADGAVKEVRVTNALPDGLTEEGMRLAYKMRFEPARKAGVPVAYWLPMVVEFNIK